MNKEFIYEDGKLTDEEMILLEQKRVDTRQDNQRTMAWVAIISIIAYTIAMFLPFVPTDRLQILTEIAPLFYIAQAGVVGAYMGSEALVNRSREQLTQNRRK